METPFNQTNIEDSKIIGSEAPIDALSSKLGESYELAKSLISEVATNPDSWDEWFPWEYF